MLYIYDKAICDDLQSSFNPNNLPNPAVRVVDPEAAIGVVAQIQNDEIQFPVVVVNRNPSAPVDRERTNFTRMHVGVATVFDSAANELYYERVIPVDLRYAITVLATNTADLDEIVRELMFKYVNMYFVTATVPYESKRKIRIGITLDPNTDIERSSGTGEYLQSGTLYQAIVPLKCDGAVLINYTPAKLRRLDVDPHVKIKNPNLK